MANPNIKVEGLHEKLIANPTPQDLNNLALTVAGVVSNVISNEAFTGKQIYSDDLDHACLYLSKNISDSSTNPQISLKNKFPVIVATELYAFGGHSLVIEEFASMHDQSMVVLTGFFPGGPHTIHSRLTVKPSKFSTLRALQLAAAPPVEMIRELRSFCNTYASEVFLVNHHHDVVAVAALAQGLSCPTFFIHHSDHRLCLGATLGEFLHVDLAKHMYDFCSQHLNDQSIFLLPQTMKDFGRSPHVTGAIRGTVTSGSSKKFHWKGEISLGRVITAALRNYSKNHFHIGDLDEKQLAQIRHHLDMAGIDGTRFVHVAQADSLWQVINNEPITLAIGSAPMHGLRTSIEYQGAGLPVLFFNQEQNSLLGETPMYASEELCWQNIEQLVSLFELVDRSHEEFSDRARKKFLDEYRTDLLQPAISEALQNWKVITND